MWFKYWESKSVKLGFIRKVVVEVRVEENRLEEVETIDHCFLKCGRVLEGWIKVLNWWKISNVTHGSVDEIKGSFNVGEDIGVDEVSSAIDDVCNIELVDDGEALAVGEDDDLGNAATDGGDDAVESRDISILNSLTGHGSLRSPYLWGTIDTTNVQVLIDKGVDKEVLYYIYTLHVLILFLKRFNDEYIKKNKMKAAMLRILWDPEIKSAFQDITLRIRWFLKVLGVIRSWLR
nr:harbinger transposase-derived nuclease domain-containing protein [Tanacetum cinerariifolium]